MSRSGGARLYLDEDVEAGLVRMAGVGADILSTQDAGMRGCSDEDQLALAVRERRALLTHNIDDFTALPERYQQEGQRHWGIITSRRLHAAEFERRLGRLLVVMRPEAVQNNLIPLEHFKDDETAILVALAYAPEQ